MSVRTTLLAALAGLAAIVATTMSPAAAARPAFDQTSDFVAVQPDHRSQVSWYPDGEWFKVEDLKGDSYSAVGQWRYYTSSATDTIRTLWNTKGKNSSKWFNLDLPEGRSIQWRACIGTYAERSVYTCGSWKRKST